MNDEKLTILWTSGDVVTAEKMVLMYALNSKLQGWFDQIILVIWGGSTKLVAENKSVRDKLSDLTDAGVIIEACKACADQLGATEILKACNVDVKYYGQSLTQVLKSDGNLLTI
ncbi:MAG: hypothetical protein K9G76_06430 [Bacteroidales bacterium]|nr:hypothetical protein [Bacteroidales bacterium]MCF8402334.1 hypothetical protein [Bacteroidales bacterium]